VCNSSLLSSPAHFVNPLKSVQDLGICFDTNLSMRCHIQKSVASCFAILCQLRSIRRSVPTSVYQTLVFALVLSRLDYGSSVLVGLPSNLYSCCTIHYWLAALGLHYWHTCQFPLVETARACAVRAGDDRLSLAEWHYTILPGCRRLSDMPSR